MDTPQGCEIICRTVRVFGGSRNWAQTRLGTWWAQCYIQTWYAAGTLARICCAGLSTSHVARRLPLVPLPNLWQFVVQVLLTYVFGQLLIIRTPVWKQAQIKLTVVAQWSLWRQTKASSYEEGSFFCACLSSLVPGRREAIPNRRTHWRCTLFMDNWGASEPISF